MRRIFTSLSIILVVIVFAAHITASWNHDPCGVAQARSIIVDSTGNNILLGVTWGGCWQSLDGGTIWEPINDLLVTGYECGLRDGYMLNALCDTIVMRIATQQLDTDIHYSFDGGNTWSTIDEDFVDNGGFIFDGDHLLIDPRSHNNWYYLNDRYFARSTNYSNDWEVFEPQGALWVQHTGLYKDTSEDSVLFYTGSYDYVFDDTNGGLEVSTDLGATWSQLINFHGLYGLDYAYVRNFIKVSNGNYITLVAFTSPESWENGNVLLSTDDGDTWERIEGGLPDRFQPDEIVEDVFSPGTLFIRGMQKYGLFRSEDYGRTWERCLNGLPENISFVNDIYQNPYSGKIYVAIRSEGVFVTEDHGESWTPLPMPPIGAPGIITVSEESVFLRDEGYRLWRMDEPDRNWYEMTSLPLSPDTLCMVRPISYYSADTLVSGIWKRPFSEPVDIFRMIYSYDNGATWTQQLPLEQMTSGVDYFNVYQSDNLVRFLTSVGNGDSLFVSLDLGMSWSISEIPENEHVMELTQNDTTIVIVTGYNVFTSNDNGETWDNLHFNGPAFDYFCSPILVNGGLIVKAWNQMYYYANGTWDQRSDIEERVFQIITVPTDNDTLLFAVGYGMNDIWISSDYAQTFEQREIELPYPGQNFGIQNPIFDPYRERIWVSTGLGVCYLDLDELAVKDRPLRLKPWDYTLLDVYPNPFNSKTRVRFDLDSPEHVTISVYDIEGRLVKKLLDEKRSMGRCDVSFDGADLASGVYFLKLQTDDQLKTKRVVLVK